MSAIISPCGQYRYRLERDGPGDGATAVIMVNPSTADATSDDATIRKLRGFGQRHGWGKIIVGNLFAYRATDVRELGKVADPVGPANDAQLAAIMEDAQRIVVAWGPIAKVPRAWRWRAGRVRRMASKPLLMIGPPALCGSPRHPLMLPYDSPLLEWQP